MTCACTLCQRRASGQSEEVKVSYVTPTPSPTIGELLASMGFEKNDDGMHKALRTLSRAMFGTQGVPEPI